MKITHWHPENHINRDSNENIKEVEFNSYEELIAIPWVNKYAHPSSPWFLDTFIRYSIAKGNWQADLLIAEYKDTEQFKGHHWIIGYLSKDCAEKLKLPWFEGEIKNA